MTNVTIYKGLLQPLKIHAVILRYFCSLNLQCYFRQDYDTLVWASFIWFSYVTNIYLNEILSVT
jgi:hypothetical protein